MTLIQTRENSLFLTAQNVFIDNIISLVAVILHDSHHLSVPAVSFRVRASAVMAFLGDSS